MALFLGVFRKLQIKYDVPGNTERLKNLQFFYQSLIECENENRQDKRIFEVLKTMKYKNSATICSEPCCAKLLYRKALARF